MNSTHEHISSPANEFVHAYDDPDLSPLEFLLAVMRDPTVPLEERVATAKATLPYVYIPVPVSREYEYTIVIPALPNAAHAQHLTPQRQGLVSPEDLQEIIRIVKATDLDTLPLCECGNRTFFPCRPVLKPSMN